ncbi:hypothetical protein PG987_012517 [Apiospora arundinis]
MSSQNDYNDLQKEASTEVSSAGENANISDDIGKEHGGQKTTTSRSPRAFFNSFDYYTTGGDDDDCYSNYCEPLLTRTASPPPPRVPSPSTRASRIFSKACGCVNRICHRPRRRQLRPRQVSFAADLGHSI